MAELMPLPLTVSCFSEIQIGFTFLVLAHPDSPGKRAVKRLCVSGLPFTIAIISMNPVAGIQDRSVADEYCWLMLFH